MLNAAIAIIIRIFFLRFYDPVLSNFYLYFFPSIVLSEYVLSSIVMWIVIMQKHIKMITRLEKLKTQQVPD